MASSGGSRRQCHTAVNAVGVRELTVMTTTASSRTVTLWTIVVFWMPHGPRRMSAFFVGNRLCQVTMPFAIAIGFVRTIARTALTALRGQGSPARGRVHRGIRHIDRLIGLATTGQSVAPMNGVFGFLKDDRGSVSSIRTSGWRWIGNEFGIIAAAPSSSRLACHNVVLSIVTKTVVIVVVVIILAALGIRNRRIVDFIADGVPGRSGTQTSLVEPSVQPTGCHRTSRSLGSASVGFAVLIVIVVGATRRNLHHAIQETGGCCCWERSFTYLRKLVDCM